MIKIKCPKCGIEYRVYRVETKNINCMDCGTVYHQGFCSDKMPEWIKKYEY